MAGNTSKASRRGPEIGQGVATSVASLTDMWGKTRTIREWQRIHEVGSILQRFGDWVVTDYGVECLTTYYPIEKRRLWEGAGYYEWWNHMAEKRWVNLEDFTAALLAGRAKHKGVRRA